jgi:carbon storage regulator
MLVLTRRPGQQIILPGWGITIEVVEVGKNQVRLGIVAPADVPVHRSEVRDRIHRQGDRQPEGKADLQNPVMALKHEPASPVPPAASATDLDLCLAQWITRRTGGGVCQLSVGTVGDRIVVRGATRSYYVRQLVQVAVGEVLGTCGASELGRVEYDINVVETSKTSDAGYAA